MSAQEGGPWVTFRCAGREYALGVHDVVEMLAARRITPLPGSRGRLAGIVSWRGRTLPVLDLPSTLKHASASPDLEKRMLVLRVPALFAVRVDEPGHILHEHEVEDVPVENVVAEREAREHGIRLVRTGSGLVRLVDPARILGDQPLTTGTERTEEDRS